MKKELGTDISIYVDSLRVTLKKMLNWKMPGHNSIHWLYLKNKRQSTTNWSRNWVNSLKKQAYPNGWWKRKLLSYERLHQKKQRKTYYSDQKQCKQFKNQLDINNSKAKMGRKAIVWIFQATNKRNLSRKDLDVVKKGKP